MVVAYSWRGYYVPSSYLVGDVLLRRRARLHKFMAAKQSVALSDGEWQWPDKPSNSATSMNHESYKNILHCQQRESTQLCYDVLMTCMLDNKLVDVEHDFNLPNKLDTR